jgi:NAD(P)-dependent dehydrogenase (short-subunit alcohol dehydrogenase family)
MGANVEKQHNGVGMILHARTTFLCYLTTRPHSHFFTTSAFVPLLAAASKSKPSHTAAVINTASISGITRTSQHHIKYNVSKAASIHLTQMLAQELCRPGVQIRVNSISPGKHPNFLL